MLKKPVILFSSCSNLQGFYFPHQLTTSPSSHRSSPRSRNPANLTTLRKQQCRRYAKVCDERPHVDDTQWPDLPSSPSVPSPYQIFKLKKGAPYSKRRFYELVKLYHPDHHDHESSSRHTSFLSYTEKLERYRLIVAANDILSCPSKRSAYDKYGAGWNGKPEIGAIKYNWNEAAGAGWSGFDANSSPAQNATWEDWEKWYQRGSKGKQEPRYFSNGSFVALIVIVAALGGIGQATRVGEHKRTFLEQIEVVHDDCSRDLQQRMKDSHDFGTKDQRIQSFLKNRDPAN